MFEFAERKAREAQERIDARHTRTSAIKAMEQVSPGTINALQAIAQAFADKDEQGKPRLRVIEIEVQGERIYDDKKPVKPADDYYRGKLRPCPENTKTWQRR